MAPLGLRTCTATIRKERLLRCSWTLHSVDWQCTESGTSHVPGVPFAQHADMMQVCITYCSKLKGGPVNLDSLKEGKAYKNGKKTNRTSRHVQANIGELKSTGAFRT